MQYLYDKLHFLYKEVLSSKNWLCCGILLMCVCTLYECLNVHSELEIMEKVQMRGRESYPFGFSSTYPFGFRPKNHISNPNGRPTTLFI